MNWIKGLNRVFVVLAFGWAIFLLIVCPLVLRTEDQTEYTKAVSECRRQMAENEANGIRYEDARETEHACNDVAKSNLVSSLQMHSVSSWIKDRALLRIGLLALLLPPAIVYGLFRLTWAVVCWIGRGFRQPSG